MGDVGQAAIVELVHSSRRPLSRIRLFKLLFLLRHQCDVCVGYDFLPYKFGPYSFTAERDLESLLTNGRLIGKGLVIPPYNAATANEQAAKTIPPATRKHLRLICERFQGWTDAQLVNKVYEWFPSYTVLSERRRIVARPLAAPAVFTTGYEGVSIDCFLNNLINAGVCQLLDVRRNPISRRFGFSKVRLSSFCARLGINYQHFPELGIESAKRRNLGGAESYQELFEWYETETLSLEKHSLEAITSEVRTRPSALVCFEADPKFCHRNSVAQKIAQCTGLPILHLSAAI
jgi:Protein of unknown function, DUF488